MLRRSGFRIALVSFTLTRLFSAPQPLPAQSCNACPGTILPVGQCSTTDIVHTGFGCGGFNNCQNPQVSGPSIETLPQPDGTFTIRMMMTVTAPWNEFYAADRPNGTLDMTWFDVSPAPPPFTSGGNPSLCEYLASDRVQTYVEKTGLTCGGAPYDFGTYSLRSAVCGGPCPPPFPPNCGCGRWVDTNGLAFVVTKSALGCQVPPPDDCESCQGCVAHAGGGPAGCASPARGGGPACSPEKSGPGALLRYRAGGAGGPGFPGSAAWTPALGLYWSHDYAQRIVPDLDFNHVWLITERASFREFSNLAAGAGLRLYQTNAPSDEYRKLYYDSATGGWQLDHLDGRKDFFRPDGLWEKTVLSQNPDHPTQASYNADHQLESVSFPDERSEAFTYYLSGRLASITENPVAGSGDSPRTWNYLWSGDELARIDRPDGTSWEFTYDPAKNGGRLGYLTQVRLIGSDGVTGRVEAAFEYDSSGNVIEAWKGDPSFTGPSAVSRQEFTYTNPQTPTRTDVKEWIDATQSETTTYEYDRDPRSIKARISKITGDCPVCGTGPNSQLTYDDAANPLLSTQIIDGRSLKTQFSYDLNGKTLTKLEAVGTSLQRLTTWRYSNASFPALPTRIEMPSTSGGSAQRVTVLSYDGAGNLETRTIQGAESGSSFTYSTLSTFNGSGQPLTIDPPGYGIADLTSYTYDPARGDLLPLTRTDPLIGATTFGYDGFNRRTSMTDPNSLQALSEFDSLNRVTTVTQKGAVPADDLATTHQYTLFGDLFRTILPRGNLIEYGYDAAGRLISVERKPDAATPGERTFYTLDSFGHRIKEELQHWDGSAWVTDSFTDFVYSSRCHLDKAVHADGSATEYAYDCDGNLEKVWDANHPPLGSSGGGGGDGDCDLPPCSPPGASGPNPPTLIYEYDELNRLKTVTQPWTGAGGTAAVTRYTYDLQDHLASVTDAEENTTNYTYSDRDLMTQEVSPVSGTTTLSYNEHGELMNRSDARAVLMIRMVDALDRVTVEDFPENTLDTTYTYDDPAVPFSKGRLTGIARNGSEVGYAYDRYGRILQDGELAYQYDQNGNRKEIGYPGGVTARWTHDFADRDLSLEIQVGSGAPQPILSGATYKPFGPLTGSLFGNGLAESRGYTHRYFPQRIQVPGRLDVAYSNDKVGNILSLDRTVGPDHFFSTYVYQDPQYFLTEGNGPWGRRAWAYDRIGNRLSETPPPDTDPPVESLAYSYLTNLAGGHTPKLTRIEPAPGDELGSRLEYGYDEAGNQTTVAHFGAESPRRTSFLDYSAESRLAGLRTSDGPTSTELLYDGRGFLRRSRLTVTTSSDFEQAEPVYSSEGLLLARRLHKQTTQGARADSGDPPTSRVTMETAYLFYFAGRPVAQLTRPQVGGAGDTLLYVTTDHLGTPIQATDMGGGVVWEGGLEPFGAPFAFPRSEPPEEGDPPGGGDGDASAAPVSPSAGAAAIMEGSGIFLRFPGQWDDSSFRSLSLHGGLYYNVYRWYQPGTGKYSSPDPLSDSSFLSTLSQFMEDPPAVHGIEQPLYLYAEGNPTKFADELGLIALVPFKTCVVLGDVITSSEPAGEGYKPTPIGLYHYSRRRITGRICFFRCYCDRKDNCPNIPCRNLFCPLDHGVSIRLRFFDKKGVRPCKAYIPQAIKQGKCPPIPG